jgi:hypothetical protein
MTDSDQPKKAKKILSEIRRPVNRMELKYSGMNAEEAWDQFFHLFTKKLKAASKIAEGDVVDEVEDAFNRGDDLSDFFATECDPITHEPKNKK